MLFKLYIVENGERLYLRDWFVFEGLDHLVFTERARHAMRFRSRETLSDYIYQLKAYGYRPRTEEC